jgi:hypothetical protein
MSDIDDVGGDRQSEEKRQEPTTLDTGAANAQADDQSSETSGPSRQQKKRGRFLGRFRKERITDSAAEAGASTGQAAKKPTIGLVGILITALVGFFFGVASNEVSDFVKRADECNDALTQYADNVASFFVSIVHDVHEGRTDAQKGAAEQRYNTLIAGPSSKIQSRCEEGINGRDYDQWNDKDTKMGRCEAPDGKCDKKEAGEDAKDVSGAATKLAGDATIVSRWGLLRRAIHVVMHPY